jgi:hypothetical protein
MWGCVLSACSVINSAAVLPVTLKCSQFHLNYHDPVIKAFSNEVLPRSDDKVLTHFLTTVLVMTCPFLMNEEVCLQSGTKYFPSCSFKVAHK